MSNSEYITQINCQLCKHALEKKEIENGDFFLLPTRYEDDIAIVCPYCFDYVAKYVREMDTAERKERC